jgi:hypothetical protein
MPETTEIAPVSNYIPVINPVSKETQYIPADNYAKARGLGFTLAPLPGQTTPPPASPQAQAGYQAQVATDQASIRNNLPLMQNADLMQRHANDDVQDANGNYKMVSPHGQKLSMPSGTITQALSDGWKFQDRNFQALVDAHLAEAKGGSADKDFWATLSGMVNTLPGASWLREKTAANLENIPDRAQSLAENLSDQTSEAGSYKLGTAVGIGAQILNPTGVLGEVSAGKAAGNAVLHAEALQQFPFLAKALAGAAEGAVISSPQALAQAVINKNPAAAAENIALGAGLGSFLKAVVSPALTPKVVPSSEEAASNLLPQMGLSQPESALAAAPEALSAANAPFAKALISQGLSEGAKDPKRITEALNNLSSEEHLVPLFKKVSSEMPVGSLEQKMSTIAYPNGDYLAASPETASELGNLKIALSKLSSEGNISPSNLQKFISDIGDNIDWQKAAGQGTINNLRIQIQSEARNALNSFVDSHLPSSDAKTLVSFQEGKTIADRAQNFLTSFNRDVAEAGLSPIESASTSSISAMLNPKAMIPQIAGLAGGALGAHAGGFLGAIVGRNIAKGAVSNLLSSYIENNPAPRWLSQNKLSRSIGSYLALDAAHQAENTSSLIVPFLRKLSESSVPEQFVAQKDPIKSLLGVESNGLSKQQQLERLSQKVSQLSASPNMLSQNANEAASIFQQFHPQLAQQIKDDFTKKIGYLNQILNSKGQEEFQPFQDKKTVQSLSPSEMQEINDQLKIAQNPYALLAGLKDGTITSKQVATAALFNPEILNSIRGEINNLAYSGKADPTYRQKLSLSILMNAPMEASLKNGMALQSTYGTINAPPGNVAPAAVPMGRGKHRGTGSHLNAEKISPMTTAQRISK